jgi:arsenate reductase
MKATIYHNPRCSKSRQTLQILQEKGTDVEVIEYLKTPPDRATLEKILKLLGIGPRALLRTGEDAYREAGLADETLSDAALIAAMIEHPTLIERPIVLSKGKAVIGRPPEKVLEIL